MDFPASSPKADEYLVEYSLSLGIEQYTRGVTVTDTNKDRYTVTQGQLTQDTRYNLRVVPYAAGRRGRASYPLYVTTLSKYYGMISNESIAYLTPYCIRWLHGPISILLFHLDVVSNSSL